MDSYEYNGHLIKYLNFKEVGQGGPEIGNLSVDGRTFRKNFYGGPLLLYKNYVILPKLVFGIFDRSFKIAIINLSTLEENLIGKKEDLILLKEVENNEICYYEDLDNTKLKKIKCPI